VADPTAYTTELTCNHENCRTADARSCAGLLKIFNPAGQVNGLPRPVLPVPATGLEHVTFDE